jgi:hypothetical protein
MCSFVYGMSNMGFSYRWLDSLTREEEEIFENKNAKQSVVESQLPDLKE